MSTFSSQDVMRFLAKKPHGNFQGEGIGDCRERSEGIRIKHRMKANSLKMYNKHAHLLRVEMTMNDPSDFKAFRPSAWDPDGPRAWRPLRKGIADLHRRAQVSQGSNERYLDASLSRHRRAAARIDRTGLPAGAMEGSSGATAASLVERRRDALSSHQPRRVRVRRFSQSRSCRSSL